MKWKYTLVKAHCTNRCVDMHTQMVREREKEEKEEEWNDERVAVVVCSGRVLERGRYTYTYTLPCQTE